MPAVMPRSLKQPVGFHAEMLELEVGDSGEGGGFVAADERSVALAEGDDLIGRIVGEEFAVAPDAADVAGIARSAALAPELLEGRGRLRRCLDIDFEESAAGGTFQRGGVQVERGGTSGIETAESHQSSLVRMGMFSGART